MSNNFIKNKVEGKKKRQQGIAIKKGVEARTISVIC